MGHDDFTQELKRAYYIGRVVEDLDPNDTELKVSSPNLTPAMTGRLAASDERVSVEIPGPDGSISTDTATTANYIVAKWWGVNQQSLPPLVKVGEQVGVFQTGDTEGYYWESLGRDARLRQIDRYRLEVSADPKRLTEKTDDNTYTFVVDPSSKMVSIKTSKANGELYTYTLTIDAQNSFITLQDNEGNRVYIDSVAQVVQLNNAAKAVVRLDKQDIVIDAPRDITIRSGRQLVLKTNTLTFQVAGAFVISAAGMTIDAAKGLYFKGRTLGVSAAMKIQGVIVATAARLGKVVYGSVGGSYIPSTTNINDGSSQVADPAPDDQIGGAGQRHAAAYEQLVTLAETVRDLLNQVKASIHVPNGQDQLPDIAQASKLEHIQDQ